MGLTRTPIIIPVLVGPILAGMIYDTTGSYSWMFLITIGMLILSTLAFLMTKTPSQSLPTDR
jgi:cyanate permease